MAILFPTLPPGTPNITFTENSLVGIDENYMSCSFWIYLQASPAGDMTVFSTAQAYSGSTAWGWRVSITNGGSGNFGIKAEYQWSTGIKETAQTSGFFSTDTWYHVSVTYSRLSRTNPHNIRVNGNSLTVSSSSLGAATYNSSIDSLKIGVTHLNGSPMLGVAIAHLALWFSSTAVVSNTILDSIYRGAHPLRTERNNLKVFLPFWNHDLLRIECASGYTGISSDYLEDFASHPPTALFSRTFNPQSRSHLGEASSFTPALRRRRSGV